MNVAEGLVVRGHSMRAFEFILSAGKKVYKKAKMPVYKSGNCYASLYSAVSVVIPPMDVLRNDYPGSDEHVDTKPVLVPTGLTVKLEESDVFEFKNSYENMKRGLITLGYLVGAGDYGTELCVPLLNLTSVPIDIHAGECIGCCVVHTYNIVVNAVVDDILGGGFGNA